MSVTEEIVPGFKFSRASYLISLLRPQIVKDLELKVFLLSACTLCLAAIFIVFMLQVFKHSVLQNHGLKIHLRNPNSLTPLLGTNKCLLLGSDMRENERQIAQFSAKDAAVRLTVYNQD